MDPGGFFLDFLVAAGIGGLIGVEREHRPDAASVIAGVRTFPLISIGGFLVAFLAIEADSPFVLMAGVFGAFGFAYMFTHLRTVMGQTGVTTPMAMVVTFLLGALIAYGYLLESVAIGVAVTFLLVTKERLHRFANYLDQQEILSALQFITLAFVLLPVTASLPSEIYGQAWLGRGALVDPYFILLIVIFVSVMSFVSLLAMRQIGPRRGIVVSGVFGGLVNSEATTASLAQRADEQSTLARAALVGIILANTTMLVRHLAILIVADPDLRYAQAIAPFLVPIAIVGGFFAWRHRAGPGEPAPALRVRNPFAVGPALRFAAIFAGVSILAELARLYLGPAGIYVAALGGLVSAGAVVGSLGGLVASNAIMLDVAVPVGLLAIALSLAIKFPLVRALNRDLATRARLPLLAMAATAALGTIVAFGASMLV